jgi:hypothetical protein
VNIGNEIMEYLESNYKDNFKNIAVSLALLTLFSVSLYMSLKQKDTEIYHNPLIPSVIDWNNSTYICSSDFVIDDINMVGDKIGIGSNYKWPIFEIKGISPSGKIAVLIGKSYFVYEIKESKSSPPEID